MFRAKKKENVLNEFEWDMIKFMKKQEKNLREKEKKKREDCLIVNPREAQNSEAQTPLNHYKTLNVKQRERKEYEKEENAFEFEKLETIFILALNS